MATAMQIDLEQIVDKPTWKQILLDLIISERLDPWNVDIIKIADGFLTKVREMKKLDLLIPANVILASAILLRYKSSYLRLYEPQPEVMAVSEENGGMEEQIPVLAIASRIPPKRQITLEELATEIEKVVKYDGVVYTPRHKGGIDEIINFALDGEDIEKTMDDICQRINSLKDREGWVLFSVLVKNSPAPELVYTLLSLLYLTQKSVVDLRQDEIFGEIFIHINKGMN